jgi:hypothetical protein
MRRSGLIAAGPYQRPDRSMVSSGPVGDGDLGQQQPDSRRDRDRQRLDRG